MCQVTSAPVSSVEVVSLYHAGTTVTRGGWPCHSLPPGSIPASLAFIYAYSSWEWPQTSSLSWRHPKVSKRDEEDSWSCHRSTRIFKLLTSKDQSLLMGEFSSWIVEAKCPTSVLLLWPLKTSISNPLFIF